MFFESLFVSLPWNSIRNQDDRKGMEGFFLVSSATAGAGFAAVRLCRNDGSKWTSEHGIIWPKNKNIFVGISNEFYIYFSKNIMDSRKNRSMRRKRGEAKKVLTRGWKADIIAKLAWESESKRRLHRQDEACEVPWKPYSDRKNLTK